MVIRARVVTSIGLSKGYLGAAPSKKSVLRIKRKISDLLTAGNKGSWLAVQARLNRLLGGLRPVGVAGH